MTTWVNRKHSYFMLLVLGSWNSYLSFVEEIASSHILHSQMLATQLNFFTSPYHPKCVTFQKRQHERNMLMFTPQLQITCADIMEIVQEMVGTTTYVRVPSTTTVHGPQIWGWCRKKIRLSKVGFCMEFDFHNQVLRMFVSGISGSSS